MSLQKALEKVPTEIEGKRRRGLLVALEGPTCSNVSETFEKIRGELGDIHYVTFPDFYSEDKIGPECDLLARIIDLRSVQDEIINNLNAGKLVVCQGHMLGALKRALADNAFGVRNMQSVAAARVLLSFMRGVIVPDITFVIHPSTEVHASRLVKEGYIESDDDYVYSKYRDEFSAISHMSEYMDGVVIFAGQALSVESDMLNMIIVRSVVNAFEPKKFYCC